MDNPFTSSAVESPTALDVQRRMEMAKMLMQQGLSPDGGTQYAPGGVAIRKSPLEGLAKMLQVYMGRQNQDQADTMQRQIQQQGTADAMKFADALRAKPAAPTGDSFQTGANEMGDEAATVPQWQGPQAPDSNKAMAIALGSQNPMLQQLGGSLLGGMVPKPDEWGTEPRYDQQGRAYLVSKQGNLRYLPDVKARDKMEFVNGQAVNPYQAAPGAVIPQQAPQNNPFSDLVVKDAKGNIIPNTPVIEAKARIAREGATNVNTYGSPLPIDIGEGRTGYLQPPTRPGGPTQVLSVPGSAKPALKPLEAGQANKVQDAQDAIGLIDMAEKLLDGATGSYTGKAVDTVAGAFGKSTKGAEAAQQLKVVQGMLVSKMPKMSGPQSDKDVIQYQQMAGLVGDDTIPVARRKAALKAVRAIQERYANSPQGKQQGGADASFGGGVVDFGSLK